jgi:hypothetical protein
MTLFVLTITKRKDIPPEAYASRELAEQHGRLHGGTFGYTIAELPVCEQDPLHLSLKSMCSYANYLRKDSR